MFAVQPYMRDSFNEVEQNYGAVLTVLKASTFNATYLGFLHPLLSTSSKTVVNGRAIYHATMLHLSDFRSVVLSHLEYC